MALDALCGMPQRKMSHGTYRNGLPQMDFEREFEALQLTDNGDADPMQVRRPPFVSCTLVYCFKSVLYSAYFITFQSFYLSFFYILACH